MLGGFRLNSIAAVVPSITATGGTVSYYKTSSNAYKVHTFTTTGSNNFIVSAVSGTALAEALLVGGGGAGGGTQYGYTAAAGGGGGGGQILQPTNITITPQTYTISVGTGGTGVNGAGTVSRATNTTAFGYTALLGGLGGGGNLSGAGGTYPTGSGNGGAGAGYVTTPATSTTTSGFLKGGNSVSGGGGGGASSTIAGTNGTTNVGGTGSAGVAINFDGISRTYSPGGGGGGATAGVGGGSSGIASTRGTGGSSSSATGNPNTVDYGGGGGGAYQVSTTVNTTAGSGNQGIAIVRYPITPVSIEYVSSATSQTTSLTFPTVKAGDIAVYFNTARNSTTTIPTSVTPTGFTSISSPTTSSMRTTVFYKICTGSEGGTALTNMTASGSTYTEMVIYRPNIPTNSIIISAVNAENSPNAPADQTLTMSTLTGAFIGFAYYAGFSSVTSRPSTVTATREIANGTIQYLKTFEATSNLITFANSTISMADYGTNSLVSFTMDIV